jgi:hypothetical protein
MRQDTAAKFSFPFSVPTMVPMFARDVTQAIATYLRKVRPRTGMDNLPQSQMRASSNIFLWKPFKIGAKRELKPEKGK